ncbi:MAG TPA: hypothetical protein PK636_01670, partial [bacterium]|nr:hypothetical protein [bacterium]
MDHHVVTGAAGVPGWFAAYPLILVGAWCAALKIISRLSGWSALAETFGFPGMFEGKVYRFQSARMGPVNLNLALNLGADESGLYLVPVFFFRLFHPPLLIPWSEIEAAPVKRFPGLRW